MPRKSWVSPAPRTMRAPMSANAHASGYSIHSPESSVALDGHRRAEHPFGMASS